MTKKNKTSATGKIRQYEPMRYAGALCPRCGKAINREEPVMTDEYIEVRNRQRKRYGNARLCNKCVEFFYSTCNNGQNEQLPKEVTDEEWESLRGKGLDKKLDKW